MFTESVHTELPLEMIREIGGCVCIAVLESVSRGVIARGWIQDLPLATMGRVILVDFALRVGMRFFAASKKDESKGGTVMSVTTAELADLEAKLQETFDLGEWSIGMGDIEPIATEGGTTREIRMDLSSLGGSRPRVDIG
ncbi:hypothetical protein ACW9HJ_08540 [Nocardia gipuzkoensis]|uniref:hypothetical protein n=1 Tax=Nocardia gipuzkoensis TaxID=2749991 RepID=UPI00237D6B3D|nr:hypothetical protein [Nocardia gipuzkoensis]MDE1671493.1 hypothetical protein [Nocardia gipuzkoensis]